MVVAREMLRKVRLIRICFFALGAEKSIGFTATLMEVSVIRGSRVVNRQKCRRQAGGWRLQTGDLLESGDQGLFAQ